MLHEPESAHSGMVPRNEQSLAALRSGDCAVVSASGGGHRPDHAFEKDQHRIWQAGKPALSNSCGDDGRAVRMDPKWFLQEPCCAAFVEASGLVFHPRGRAAAQNLCHTDTGLVTDRSRN